jgi:uncharacterized protein (TIGR02231 family)
MKKLIAAILLICVYHVSAQQKDTINASATLSYATVYYGYGAELQHSAKAPLIKGLQQVVINNFALQPDLNTIQIGCPENVTILSWYHRIYTKPLPVMANPVSTKANDTIKLLQKQLASVNNEYSIQEDILRRITLLIENNFATTTKKEISSEDLIKLTAYYTDRVKDIKFKMYDLQLKRSDITDRINEVTNRQNTAQNAEPVNPESKPTGQLILQILAQAPGSVNFDVSYFTRNAGWIPAYDIRVKTLDNSLKLVYKASVTQSTGLDWKAVKLNLSTSNPNQGTIVPAMAPTYLQLYVPALYNTMQDKSIDDNKTPELLDVVVTAGASKRSTSTGYSTQHVSDYMILKESQLNIGFEIDLPYDIPSDGKAYTVSIKDEQVPATYKHYAVPKLDNDAFLVAELSRWDSLGLLPGQANIIMDNVYLGKSFIDPNTTTDTLNLSLGRDKRISIKRTLVKEFTKTSTRGETKTEQFTYEITVKNNKKQSLTMLLKDQYPVSKQKEVEVTLTKDGGGENDVESGMLKWNIKLQPGESRKFRFSYSIKYPKDKILQEIR